jgi:superfamily I DNA/RNA helicase
MRMIRKGRRVRIEGKDIGAGLMALVKKLAGRTNSIPAFLGKLKTWKEKEIARLEKALKEPESAIEKITDKAETLRVLAEGVSGLAEMNARITSLFSDRDDQGNPQSFITCSSVHKSKGLEAHRVVMLSDTFKSPTNSKREVSPKQIREEQNIRYVAITRAKNILIYASGNA